MSNSYTTKIAIFNSIPQIIKISNHPSHLKIKTTFPTPVIYTTDYEYNWLLLSYQRKGLIKKNLIFHTACQIPIQLK